MGQHLRIRITHRVVCIALHCTVRYTYIHTSNMGRHRSVSTRATIRATQLIGRRIIIITIQSYRANTSSLFARPFRISDPDLFDYELSVSCKQAVEGVFRVGLKMGVIAWQEQRVLRSTRGTTTAEMHRGRRGGEGEEVNGRSAQRMAATRISAISVEVRISQPLRTLQYLISRFKSHVRTRVLVTSLPSRRQKPVHRRESIFIRHFSRYQASLCSDYYIGKTELYVAFVYKS